MAGVSAVSRLIQFSAGLAKKARHDALVLVFLPVTGKARVQILVSAFAPAQTQFGRPFGKWINI